MPKPELAVLIPTRGRPGNIHKVIAAWDFTNAWDVADMLLIADADDPEIEGYRDLAAAIEHPDTGQPLVRLTVMPEWVPMVHKLNQVAANLAQSGVYFALGFAGDDHLPQTIGWAKRYLTVLHELGSGMVFGDDGYQGANLSTEWAVTSDAVHALGRMVPAPVQHMYCDNSMMALFDGAGALRHLPEVRIEHMHPIAGKAENDDQYKRVNHRDQFKRDRAQFESWQRSGMLADIAAIRALRPGQPDVRPDREPARRPGLMPRAVPPRSRGQRAVTRFGIPRHFKKVRGATPDEIGVTLADMASQVPGDQAIVELGVFQGRTSLLMAWGARQGGGAHLWGIDAWDLPGNTYGPPFNEVGSKTWAEYNVMALGYNSGITLIQDFAVSAAQAWPDGAKIGLLFIDDDHSYTGARQAVLSWAPHLAPGAVIALDDYGHPDWPGVKEAVDELVTDGYLAPLEIFHERLAVTRLVKDSDTQVSTPTAITSEGVSPEPVNTESGPPEGWVRDGEGRWAPPVQGVPIATFSDTEPDRGVVQGAELGSVLPGTRIDDLNTGQLRALARARGIRLGTRKDLRESMLQALRDGE